MSSLGSGISFTSDSFKESGSGDLTPTSFEKTDDKGNGSKKWYIVAAIIGSLVVIGVGGFGAVGLFQSHGIIALPHSLQWLTSAIGTIGQTPHFWSLWTMAGGGLVVGGSLLAFGIHGAKKSSALDGVPQSSDRAHRITWMLKAPFNFCVRTAISIIYPLQGSACQKIWGVVKKIFKVIVVILLFIPASLLYGLGAISSQVSDTPRINPTMLHLVPPPLKDPTEDLDDDAVLPPFEAPAENLVHDTAPQRLEGPVKHGKHDLDVLQEWFDAETSRLYQTEFHSMIQNIKERNQFLIKAHENLPESFYDDMTLYLKKIIICLNRNPERKKDVLTALAEAANVCPPTWYETARKQLQLLVGSNDGPTLLLHWIQDIKEEIILHVAQNTFDSDWHALNYVRYHAGKELGLNTAGLKNDKYFQEEEDSRFTKDFIIKMFKAHFHTDNLITALQMKINETYQVLFYDMLKGAITARGEKDPNGYVAAHFYEEDCMTMNRNGVIMLLKIIGYLQ